MAGVYFSEKFPADFDWSASNLAASIVDTRSPQKLEMGLSAFCRFCRDLENLVAMFGVGEKPSGGKDPRGLRVIAQNLAHSMMEDWRFQKAKSAIRFAQESFEGKIDDAQGEVYDFILERIRAKIVADIDPLGSHQYARESADAALSKKPDTFRNLMPRVRALWKWRSDPKSGAETLVAANKRINNIFRKSGISPDSPPIGDPSILVEKEEKDLLAIAGAVNQKSGTKSFSRNKRSDWIRKAALHPRFRNCPQWRRLSMRFSTKSSSTPKTKKFAPTDSPCSRKCAARSIKSPIFRNCRDNLSRQLLPRKKNQSPSGKRRRACTASANPRNIVSVSSQPAQPSVMLCPKTNSRPGSHSWRPATRWLSIIAPMTR